MMHAVLFFKSQKRNLRRCLCQLGRLDFSSSPVEESNNDEFSIWRSARFFRTLRLQLGWAVQSPTNLCEPTNRLLWIGLNLPLRALKGYQSAQVTKSAGLNWSAVGSVANTTSSSKFLVAVNFHHSWHSPTRLRACRNTGNILPHGSSWLYHLYHFACWSWLAMAIVLPFISRFISSLSNDPT